KKRTIQPRSVIRLVCVQNLPPARSNEIPSSARDLGCGPPWEMRIAAVLFTRCRGHASLLWRAVTRPAVKLLVAESVIEKSINPLDISADRTIVDVSIAM